jgi:hypothetical protein
MGTASSVYESTSCILCEEHWKATYGLLLSKQPSHNAMHVTHELQGRLQNCEENAYMDVQARLWRQCVGF